MNEIKDPRRITQSFPTSWPLRAIASGICANVKKRTESTNSPKRPETKTAAAKLRLASGVKIAKSTVSETKKVKPEAKASFGVEIKYEMKAPMKMATTPGRVPALR